MTSETAPLGDTIIDLINKAVDYVLKYRGKRIKERVDKLKFDNKGLTDRQIAQKIVDSRSFYSGVAGGVTSLGGAATLPLSIPANLVSSLLIQAEMVLAVAYVYGLDMESDDRKRDLLVLLAGNGVLEVLRNLGVEAGKRLTKQIVDKYVTREVMKRIWKVVGVKTITKAGEKSTYSIMKIVPFISAPIGFTIDYSASKLFGGVCIKYYSNEGIEFS